MHPDIEFMPAAVEFAGGDDFGGVVEIVPFDAEELAAHPLKVGLSMTVKIDTRSGAQ